MTSTLRRWVATLVAVALALPDPSVWAAPKPKDKGPTEKELKEFATMVGTTKIKKDIDGFLDMCDTPFHRPGGYLAKEKDDLRQWITKALNNGRYREDVNEVKRVETFEAAKTRLSPADVGRVSQVLADEDFVVYVEMEQVGIRKYEFALLIKARSGKPRLVGMEVVR